MVRVAVVTGDWSEWSWCLLLAALSLLLHCLLLLIVECRMLEAGSSWQAGAVGALPLAVNLK